MPKYIIEREIPKAGSLSAEELRPFVPDESRAEKKPEKPSGQKEAVLYALRELREPGGTP